MRLGVSPLILEARFSDGSWTNPRKGQDDARNHRNTTHDRIEHDRVWPRHVDGEEPDVRHGLRGEERETRNHQGGDAQDDEKKSDYYEWSHLQSPIRVEPIACMTVVA